MKTKRGEPKIKDAQDEPPKGRSSQDERPRGNMQDDDQSVEKTFVRTAVQIGLITIPLAVYVSWAYKKFFPCPRVKCKPIPKPKKNPKLEGKSCSKSRLPSLCTVMESMVKRYCTNGAKAKKGFVDNCRCRHVQELPRDVDPCETLRYDVRDDSYDRRASAKSKKPFASFFEDDFRDEVDASRKEQAYTEDRYRERPQLPERKSRVLKNRSSKDTERHTPHQQTLQPEQDECVSAEVQTMLRECHNQETELKQPGQIALNKSTSELNELEERAPTTMTYCEYLKRPILDYDPQEHTQTETELKKNERPPTEPNGKPSTSTALVVYNPQQSGDNICSDSTDEEVDLHARQPHQASPVFNITPEVIDTLCQQYIREYQNTLAKKEQNIIQGSVDRSERVNPKKYEMQASDCCEMNSDIDDASGKSEVQDTERVEDEGISKNQEDTDACNDKYIQEILKRYKTQSVESKQNTSPGENEFETVDSTKPRSYNGPCDANFHSKNSDTPYVVKDYACKSKKGNDDSGDKSVEDFENRQQHFWHSCDPPKSLQKGCRVSPKDKGPCDD